MCLQKDRVNYIFKYFLLTQTESKTLKFLCGDVLYTKHCIGFNRYVSSEF